MLHTIGRALAAAGAAIIWLPFAALAGLYILLALSSPGLGATDMPFAVASIAIVVGLPILTWRATHTTGIAAPAALALVGVVVPLVWMSLLRPDHSAPLYWIAGLAILGGGATALGSLLMIASQASRPEVAGKVG